MRRVVYSCALMAFACGGSDEANPFASGGAGGTGGDGATGAVASGGDGAAPATGGTSTGGTGGVTTGGAGGITTGGAAGATSGAGGVAPVTGGTAGAPTLDGGGAASSDAGGVAMEGGSLDGGIDDAAGPGDRDAAPGIDASSDGSPTADSGTSASDAGAGRTMRCGPDTLTCSVDEAQICCATFDFQSNITTYACLASGASTNACNSAERYCDSADDCTGGQVCCADWYTGGFVDRYADFTCVDSCSGSDAVIGCRSAGDCAAGSFCCGDLTSGGSLYAELSCASSCSEETICDTVDDCPDPDNQDCVQDPILPPGFGHCVSD